MKFRDDGTFKVLQFSDPQIGLFWLDWCWDIAPSERRYECSARNTTDFMKRVIEKEKPDLVVYVGDLILASVSTLWTRQTLEGLFEPVVEAEVPFAVVLGNHDTDGLMSLIWNRRVLMRYVESLPGSLATLGMTQGFCKAGTYYLRVEGRSGGFGLWFFDSGSYSLDPTAPGYDWISEEQIEWYEETVGAGSDQRSMAFFHIPTAEWRETTDRVGERHEGVSSPVYNSGLLNAMVGHTSVVTVGHDHVNDDCGLWNGIQLCYSGGMGYTTYGREGWARRVRVFEVNETNFAVRTWKRLDDRECTVIDEQIFYM